MAFDQEAIKQLSQELVGGFNLNDKLLALLGHPLDGRGQEEAMAISQELSRVFMVSLFMLKLDGNKAEEVRTAPEIRTDGSICSRTPTKDKRISREEVTPFRKGREEDATRKEITPSPHKDGYEWRKYGQKTIRNSNFARYYYKCTFSRDRGCGAKKQVQQQEDSSSDPPMFQVTYVNEHTCQRAVSTDDITTGLPMATSAGVLDSARYGSVEENEAIVSCLATVINGGAPPLVAEASLGDPFAYVAPAGSMADEMTMAEMDFSYDPSYSPVETAELISRGDVPMDDDVARFMDTVWLQ